MRTQNTSRWTTSLRLSKRGESGLVVDVRGVCRAILATATRATTATATSLTATIATSASTSTTFRTVETSIDLKVDFFFLLGFALGGSLRL